MKIAGDVTSMDATRSYTEVNNFHLGLQTGMQTSPFEPNQFNSRFRSLIGNPAPISPGQQQASAVSPPSTTLTTTAADDTLRVLTGEIVGEPIRLLATETKSTHPIPEGTEKPISMQATITSRFVHYEREEIYFSSSGTVATEDGREISFALDLSMERTSIETLDISIAAGPQSQYLLDPLILSFTGGPPSFSNTSFLFDLDFDGQKENIAGLQPGCGFLAFDQNNDGIINNGRELFGPNSGNGFTDLAAFDSDSNLWIDENDEIFTSLSIWRPNDVGEPALQSLSEAGVGAISLSHAGTTFTIEGSSGEAIAQVAANGIFLTEDGEVRSLQEVDLAIDKTDTTDAWEKITVAETFRSLVKLQMLVAMQRTRARLNNTRQQLEQQLQKFSLLRTSEPVTAEGINVWGTGRETAAVFPPLPPMNNGNTSIDPVTKERLDQKTVDQKLADDSLIQPLLSFHEIENLSWQSFQKRWKNSHLLDI